MGKQLLWGGKNYHKPLPIKIIFSGISIGLLIISSGQAWILSIILFLPVLWAWFTGYGYNLSELCLKRSINDGYYNSMREALITPYPHGVVYILENTLKHLDNFGINKLPLHDKFYDTEYGWPNKTVLKEAINIAKYAIEKWDDLKVPEKSSIMAEIRQMIKPEVMYLAGKILHNPQTGDTTYYGPNIKINKNHYYIDIYKYYYDEDDYRREKGNGPLPPPLLPPPVEPPPGVLTFEKFLQQHPGLLYLSQLEQREEYHKYLVSMGVKPDGPNEEDDPVWDDTVWDDTEQDYKGQSRQAHENYKKNYPKEDDSVW